NLRIEPRVEQSCADAQCPFTVLERACGQCSARREIQPVGEMCLKLFSQSVRERQARAWSPVVLPQKSIFPLCKAAAGIDSINSELQWAIAGQPQQDRKSVV